MDTIMPKKPTKWGIKAWVAADSHNGYVWNLQIYTGTSILYKYYMTITYLHSGKDHDANPEKGLAHNVVMSLVSGLSGQGYHIYTDNFYTSPELFLDLYNNKFEACGTVCSNRKGITKEFQSKSMPKGKK